MPRRVICGGLCLFIYIMFLLSVTFSSPGRSPGRAIVLPPASALASASALVSAAASVLAKSLTLKFFM